MAHGRVGGSTETTNSERLGVIMPGSPIPIPSPFPNLEFPKPWWLNQLKSIAIIGCADPALLFVEMALPAALEAAWTIATPSTKQIIHATTGGSWVCHAKSIIGDLEKADKYASNANTKFMYGLWRGLDTEAYFVFLADVAGHGLMNWASMVNKSLQVCKGNEPTHRGVHTIYGAPWYPGPPTWGSGPIWLNSYGKPVYAPGNVRPGGTYNFACWFGLAGLSNGGVHWLTRIRGEPTGTIYDECETNTIANPHDQAIVRAAGAWPADAGVEFGLSLEVQVLFSVDARVVANGGGCYATENENL
jgi:hypothetical protein